MARDFTATILAAEKAGLLKQCEAVLTNLAQSARWYCDKTCKLDHTSFVGLRDYIDEAEALWKASQSSADAPPK